MSDLLFDISPIEDEDSKKKKPSKRKKNEEPVVRSGPVDYKEGYVPGYIASLDVPCDRCGTSVTDLAEVRKNEWLVVCGWGCSRQWAIDPIPGVLDSQKEAREFILRDGRFKGKTLSEVWAAGDEWYVRGLAKTGGKTMSARAAKDWLAKNGY